MKILKDPQSGNLGAPQPCMLLDCRTRDGQSGSPVIFWADATKTFIGPHQKLQSGPASAPAWNLVGVYSGRIHKDSDIGMVWKRPVVEEIIETGSRPERPLVMPLEADALEGSPDPDGQEPLLEI